MNIVITGGTKGIGEATAIHFAAKGHNIAICSRNEDDLIKVKSNLLEANPEIQVIAKKCDVSDKTALKEFAEQVISNWGRVDVLINNAGQYIHGSLLEEKDGTLEHLLKVNLNSAYYLTRWLLPVMPEHGKSHIFNIGSVASIQPFERCGSYTISKFALLGFSKTLREELKPNGIRVTSVLPGAVNTDSWEKTALSEERFIPPADIAAIIYDTFMLSERTVVEEILIRPMKGDL